MLGIALRLEHVVLAGGVFAFVGCRSPARSDHESDSRPTATTPSGSSAPQSPAAADDPAPKDAAAKLYRTRCAMCHGETGRGDGPTARVLRPSPRDFADESFQTFTTDQAIAKVIVQGGAAVGKSPVMPASSELTTKPAVVTELVSIVRSFRHQAH